jgi:hypothetical protein
MHRNSENAKKLLENLKGWDHLADLVIDWRILQWLMEVGCEGVPRFI